MKYSPWNKARSETFAFFTQVEKYWAEIEGSAKGIDGENIDYRLAIMKHNITHVKRHLDCLLAIFCIAPRHLISD